MDHHDTSFTMTRLLNAASSGDAAATEELLEKVYGELHRLASWCMRGQTSPHTLEATGLVHEVYVKLFGTQRLRWEDRGHFFAYVVTAMRNVLADHARARTSAKRLPPGAKISLDDAASKLSVDDLDLIDFDDALARLTAADARSGRIAEYRLLMGLTVSEVAELLATPARTVERDWRFAKFWLRRELGG